MPTTGTASPSTLRAPVTLGDAAATRLQKLHRGASSRRMAKHPPSLKAVVRTVVASNRLEAIVLEPRVRFDQTAQRALRPHEAREESGPPPVEAAG